jgi:AcrR family transcriptional regulator
MSKTSSATLQELAELRDLLGGPVRKLEVDHRDLAIAVLTGRARGEILAAAKEAGVGVRELARRLGVSAAAVSRHLRSEGDMRFSTAAIFADALGHEWRLALVPLAARQRDRKNSEHYITFEVEEAHTLPAAKGKRGRANSADDQDIYQELKLAA